MINTLISLEIWIACDMSILSYPEITPFVSLSSIEKIEVKYWRGDTRHLGGHFLNLFLGLKKILKKSPYNSHLSLWENVEIFMNPHQQLYGAWARLWTNLPVTAVHNLLKALGIVDLSGTIKHGVHNDKSQVEFPIRNSPRQWEDVRKRIHTVSITIFTALFKEFPWEKRTKPVQKRSFLWH